MRTIIVLCAFMALYQIQALAIEDLACTKEYDPICGSDNNTYSNGCVLESENCKKPCDKQVATEQRGVCGGPPSGAPANPKKCEHNYACTLEYSPLCGSDGVTYGNQCSLNRVNCRRCKKCKITVVKNCECERDC